MNLTANSMVERIDALEAQSGVCIVCCLEECWMTQKPTPTDAVFSSRKARNTLPLFRPPYLLSENPSKLLLVVKFCQHMIPLLPPENLVWQAPLPSPNILCMRGFKYRGSNLTTHNVLHLTAITLGYRRMEKMCPIFTRPSWKEE